MSTSNPPPAVNVQEIMREIRGRTRGAWQRRAEIQGVAERAVSATLNASLWHLENTARELRDRVGLIGAMPPEPATLRGRAGAAAIRMLQRALFWLLPVLRENQMKVAEGFEHEARALREVAAALRGLSARIEALRRTVDGERPA